MCDAERQLKRIAFELDMQATAGIWNPGKIRAMLTTEYETCKHERGAYELPMHSPAA